MTAELHDDTVGLLGFDDIENVLEGERFEIKPVAGVVVGGDRLWVAVHHDGGQPLLLQSKGGMAAAVIELDALADAVGATAKNHHLAATLGLHFTLGRQKLQVA